jgi:hypothetical protein
MQKFLFFIKSVFRMVLLVGLVCYIVFFPFVIKFVNKQNPVEEIFGLKSGGVVLDMWHIEAFEGGTNPRKYLLEKISSNFNKANRGVFVAVISMTPEQYSINIKQTRPDILSFASGTVSYDILTDLPRQKTLSEELLNVCQKDGELLCYPYMLGRYALISKEKISEKNLAGSIVEDKKKKIYPLSVSSSCEWQKVLNSQGYIYDNVKSNSSQYDNYVDFLSGNTKVMLGSQRDVHRLKNREEKGKIDGLYYSYLGGYTDMAQFVGVCKSSKNIDVAKAFCEYILTQDSQSQISSVGMFSAVYDIYADGYMNDWESVIKNTSIKSPF